MLVSKKMNVSAVQLFDAIKSSIAYDYEQATGQPISLEDIKEGLCYVKRLSTKVNTSGEVEVQITKFEDGKCYESSIHSNQGVNISRYTITPSSDGIIFDYEEIFQSDSKAKRTNFKLMSKLYAKNNEKKMLSILDQIESSILR